MEGHTAVYAMGARSKRRGGQPVGGGAIQGLPIREIGGDRDFPKGTSNRGMPFPGARADPSCVGFPDRPSRLAGGPPAAAVRIVDPDRAGAATERLPSAMK